MVSNKMHLRKALTISFILMIMLVRKTKVVSDFLLSAKLVLRSDQATTQFHLDVIPKKEDPTPIV